MISWNFHQAVRVDFIVNALEQRWRLMDLLRNGNSEILLSSQSVFSISIHVLSDWL